MRDVQLLVLTAIASQPLPGHRIQREVEAMSGRPVGPGTLYGALRKLEDAGSVAPTGERGRGVPYGLTEQGRLRLADQVARVELVVEKARAGLGAPVWTA